MQQFYKCEWKYATLCSASDPSIFSIWTDSHTPLSDFTFFNRWLSPKTKYFIQPHWTSTLSKINSLMHISNTLVSQILTDDQSTMYFPLVIMENFHSAFVRAATTNQLNCLRWWVLEARSLKSRCRQGNVFFEGSGEKSFLALS